MHGRIWSGYPIQVHELFYLHNPTCFELIDHPQIYHEILQEDPRNYYNRDM